MTNQPMISSALDHIDDDGQATPLIPGGVPPVRDVGEPPPRRRGGWLRRNVAWMAGILAAVVVGMLLFGSTSTHSFLRFLFHRGPVEGVLNGSATENVSGWSAGSDAGPITLTRVQMSPAPSGTRTAIDVRRGPDSGQWTVALAKLRTPETFFVPGRTYRMSAYVRDLNASNRTIGILLANKNFAHQPTELNRYESYEDKSWHLLTRTFVCIRPAEADTGLYFELPASGPLHVQITAASVKEASAPHPPRARGPATQVLSFDGPQGSAPDETVWNHELGGHGWGNGEQQTYTANPANAQLDGSGHLVITALRQQSTGPDGKPRPYTSARLNTEEKVIVRPGSYVEASIRAPAGEAVWPAFWLVGTALPKVGWPACGELDIFEASGTKSTLAHTTVHTSLLSDPRTDSPFPQDKRQGSVDLKHPLDSELHRYGVYFDDSMIRFYIDRKEHMAFDAADAYASGRSWPFGNSFYIVLNVAVGGSGDASRTQFPKSMTVGPISIWSQGTPF